MKILWWLLAWSIVGSLTLMFTNFYDRNKHRDFTLSDLFDYFWRGVIAGFLVPISFGACWIIDDCGVADKISSCFRKIGSIVLIRSNND